MKKDKVRGWLRRLNRRWRPFAHLTDAQLMEELAKAQRGEDPSVELYPGDPHTWPPTGLEHLSDAELMKRTDEVRAEIRSKKGGTKP
jgi:hypothetical protein